MARLFMTPILSKYANRRIQQIGYFGILPVEILNTIFEYVIQNSSLKDIIYLMHTCNFIRSLLRAYQSTYIQTRLPTWITLNDYKIISGLINYSTKEIAIRAHDYDSEWHLLNKFGFVAISSVYGAKVLRMPPQVKRLILLNVTGFDWSLTTQLTHLILKSLSISMSVLDQILKQNKDLCYLQIEDVSGISSDDIDYIMMFYPKIKVRYIRNDLIGVSPVSVITGLDMFHQSSSSNTTDSLIETIQTCMMRKFPDPILRMKIFNFYSYNRDTSLEELLGQNNKKKYYEPLIYHNLSYDRRSRKNRKFVWTHRLLG